jgi:beta-phosphoglucomutase
MLKRVQAVSPPPAVGTGGAAFRADAPPTKVLIVDDDGNSAARPVQLVRLRSCILDVDGVLLASPHEQAWREALVGLADPRLFTTAIYQAEVAGKPRLAGAQATLRALGVADADLQAVAYSARKQGRLEALIRAGAVSPFPDALRFIAAALGAGFRLAAASSSKNANAMMRPLRLASGLPLLDAFSVNVCGRDLAHGKPDPEIFLHAAQELQVWPDECLVVEDAPAGIAAARAGAMKSVAVARRGDFAALRATGADLVVTSLDQVSIEGLSDGRLCRTPR